MTRLLGQAKQTSNTWRHNKVAREWKRERERATTTTSKWGADDDVIKV